MAWTSFTLVGSEATHLNLSSGRHLPRAMTPKCLTYTTRIWAMMLTHAALVNTSWLFVSFGEQERSQGGSRYDTR